VKATARESADLKMALKHDPVSPFLRAEADAFPAEADEALHEVERGWDTAAAGSWVEEVLCATEPS
jgi:hypothetical protein